MSKQVSDEIRKIIIKMTNTGQRAQQISEALVCSRHEVHRVVKAFNTDGTISRKNSACKPSKLSDEHIDFIMNQIDVDCSLGSISFRRGAIPQKILRSDTRKQSISYGISLATHTSFLSTRRASMSVCGACMVGLR
ncbi:hypothetical protein RF11_04632 [Thelohanellus kitauei]|uniref:Paired domain-containing protein n=1 Tax=Thelohanellus kitauei TaxID=669202 RepID=A0A0C2N3X4_THEKT|nr:hypothetical protein RF11_04632 [Thelohanellus kitauei]